MPGRCRRLDWFVLSTKPLLCDGGDLSIEQSGLKSARFAGKDASVLWDSGSSSALFIVSHTVDQFIMSILPGPHAWMDDAVFSEMERSMQLGEQKDSRNLVSVTSITHPLSQGDLQRRRRAKFPLPRVKKDKWNRVYT